MMRLITTIIAFLCFTLMGTANAGECYRFAFIGFNSRVADSNLDAGLVKNYSVLQEMLMFTQIFICVVTSLMRVLKKVSKVLCIRL